ncbi:MAG TPA: AraC family transcriptional regulator [Gemmatimonadaceae bacterium]|jgi:AraC-like DNA-binding protein|nr:AraC family transcriptional regulator [Gemmatimonadaceae bacterium]
MTGRPHRMLDRPDRAPAVALPPSNRQEDHRMDPLSDVLRAVKLNGAYFYRVEAARPWSVHSAPARELLPRILPEAEHLIAYHILLRGSAWAGVDGERQVLMQPGDVVVFPHGEATLMSSDEGRKTGPILGSVPDRYPNTVLLGPTEGRDTAFVCGFMGVDTRPFNPLLAALPPYIHLPGVAGGWLARFPEQVVAESREARVGSESVLTRMAELMFVEVLRRHVEQLGSPDSGWFAGLTDPVVGAALSRLHERPEYDWTLAELARATAASRTVLVERFTRLVGMPPMLYLTRWRLQLAADRLSRSGSKVAVIGAQVGYASEAAFSRAFKRETGMSPATWRRAGRATD